VSSRARLEPFGIGGHLPVDDVGEPSFQSAHGFHRGLAFSEFAPVVAAVFGVVAELNDGHDVPDPVDAPVAGPRQAVPVLVAGGRVDGCGAVPGGEVGAAGEPADVCGVADEAGGAGRADAVQFLEAAAGRRDEFGQLLVRDLDLLV
jgi:hypothetical protein